MVGVSKAEALHPGSCTARFDFDLFRQVIGGRKVGGNWILRLEASSQVVSSSFVVLLRMFKYCFQWISNVSDWLRCVLKRSKQCVWYVSFAIECFEVPVSLPVSDPLFVPRLPKAGSWRVQADFV